MIIPRMFANLDSETFRRLFRRAVCIGIVTCFCVFHQQTCNAQMPQDVRDIFDGMLDSLDKDVQQRFKDAIQKDTTQVEFTPDEFKRFRANPVNPFEGLDRIKVGNRKTNIVLNFELPSMRDRKIKVGERQTPALLRGLYPAVSRATASTVKVFAGKRQVAMGAVVQSDGFILTKFSEVQNQQQIRVELPNQQSFSATVFKMDTDNDLAIIKINTAGLSEIQWSDARPELGSFLVTPSNRGEPIAIGAYSVRPRSTREGEQAFLGVQPMVTEGGLRVSEIERGTAAFAAGLENGDIIVSLDGKRTVDVSSLVRAIRERRPGDTVDILYRRNGVDRMTIATLAGAGLAGERAARFKMMNRLGAVPSRRDSDFPNVFQHDTPLFPEQCGGPVVDLDGQVVGLNIARKGRAASYALPATHLKTLIKEMLRMDITAEIK